MLVEQGGDALVVVGRRLGFDERAADVVAEVLDDVDDAADFRVVRGGYLAGHREILLAEMSHVVRKLPEGDDAPAFLVEVVDEDDEGDDVLYSAAEHVVREEGRIDEQQRDAHPVDEPHAEEKRVNRHFRTPLRR